jgi:hypothetical protein
MKARSAVEMTGLWKTRKTKPRFPFVSPGPWKSLRDSHIPTAPTVALFINGKQIRKTQERSPAECAPELYSFRLILGLENAQIYRDGSDVKSLEHERRITWRGPRVDKPAA